MAALDVLVLKQATPQIIVPATGTDTYNMPSPTAIAAGTATTAVSALSTSQAWNNAGVTFTGHSYSITDPVANAGSAAASLHSNWLAGTAGTTSIMSLRKDGVLSLPNTGVGTSAPLLFGTGGQLWSNGATVLGIGAASSQANPHLYLTNGPSTPIDFLLNTTNASMSGSAAGVLDLGVSTAGCKRVYLDYTITAAAATGNKTINKAAGTIRIAAAGTTVTLTNSLITANTIVHCYLGTADATAKSVVNVAAAGSTVFTLNAAATAEVEIRWSLVNTD